MTITNIIKVANYKQHLLFSFLLRLVLIVSSNFHDAYFQVPYTDIDYKVFTDASRHMLENNSPYRRHTYRYTPLIAAMLSPNLLIHISYGKILLSAVDVVAAVNIRRIVQHCMKAYFSANKKKECNVDVISNIAMFIWLYNPITIGIATRGSIDSLSGYLILTVLYFLQCKKSYFLAGLFYGIAIHIRLYPIIYSLALFLHLSNFASNYPNFKAIQEKETNKIANRGMQKEKRTIFKKKFLFYLVPNFDQLLLVMGCITSLSLLTGVFYYIYRYEFLYESYIYHLVRKDTRHNFSLYFYLQYLTAGINVGLWQKVLMSLPQLVLIIVFSVHFGLKKYALNFVVLMLTCIFVTYNSVLTSQYFVWILAVLPLCIWQISMSKKSALSLSFIWLIAQALWLFSAYLLEFQGLNTFLTIWFHSVAFFCANIAIMAKMVTGFTEFNKLKLEHAL